jgi:hypothetical protein
MGERRSKEKSFPKERQQLTGKPMITPKSVQEETTRRLRPEKHGLCLIPG